MAKFTRQPRRNETKIAGMYDLEERLGSGHFAEVKLARHVFTGERVAVKVIDKLKLDETAKHHLYQEVRCMKLVQHPNIVRLYEVIDTKTKLYLVQELGDGGDMYDYIMKHESGLSEDKARRYFRQILQAIDYCHRLYVVHRDLKPENVIFFKKYDVAKLTDFGFSNKFLPGTKLQTACGSLAYSAPEILLGDSYDAPAVDIWSLGVILYMMVAGKAPFYEANESETLTMILDCKFNIPDHVSSTCQSLISRMIVRDACQRATLEDILDDPWVQGDYGPVVVTSIPLANQVKIGVDQHNEIVEKMQLGDIADRETIKKCLDSGSYNHVSATYYLLAEQILRRLRWRTSMSSSISSSALDSEVKSHVIKRNSLPPRKTKDSQSDNDQCLNVPLVEELPLSDGTEEPEDIDMNLITSKLRYHSSESIYDEVKKSEEHHNQEEIAGAISLAMTTNQRKTFQKKRVAKVKSTPAFLNQISEERESDLDDSPRASPRVRRSSRRPLNVIQKTRHPSQASSGGRRSSSHSSSSEDDGDLDKKMRRLSTERCRRSPKRRSDDEGDGDDGDGATKGPHGVVRKKMMSEKAQQRGSNKDTSSAESGNSSNEQGKSAPLEQHSELLKDKLFNVHMKLNEDQNMNSMNNTMDRPANNCETHFFENILNLPNIEQPLACSDKAAEKPRFLIRGDYVDNMETSVQDIDNLGNAIECSEGIERNSENVIECSEGVESNSENVLKPHDCTHSESEDKVKSVVVLVDPKNFSILSKDSAPHCENKTSDFENVATTQKKVKFLENVSNDNSEILNTTANVVSDTCAVYNGDLTEEKGDMDLMTEESEVNYENSNNVIKRDNVAVDGIMEIFKERSLTNETFGNNSDKENEDVTAKGKTCCANGDTARMRGSDIDEIEMYMKNKDSVRSIFNNPKVSRVTSNCCQIV